jgi:hypothetical protein
MLVSTYSTATAALLVVVLSPAVLPLLPEVLRGREEVVKDGIKKYRQELIFVKDN